MSWQYEQVTGNLSHDGVLVANGYSGFGLGKNNQDMEHVWGVGPIPRGVYDIGPAIDSHSHGPVSMCLSPGRNNNMFGRVGFLIHGESITHEGFASRGCIILPRTIRQEIAASQDRKLEVI